MNNFTFITPEEVIRIDKSHTLEEFKKMANAKPIKCQCGQEDIWKYGECGLCFSCTTGESDASDDYEIISLIK
ncbi:hypothetical protein KJ836_02835 [Patescibacteria group bacterium]|nr:hypothetical protein [Patescibacteria group bacterium]